MKLSLLTLICISSVGSALADISQAPPNFPYGPRQAVYVDFQSAHYKITYDVSKQKASIESEMVFEMPDVGSPIFDLIPTPTDLTVDGAPEQSSEISDPDGVSKFRVVNRILQSGTHRMTMKHELKTGVSFRSDGVASAFWMSDLDDREYLEQYLPTNMEFDQIPMSMRVEFVGAAGKPHLVRTNGAVTNVSENVFDVQFPAYFTTSSVFFHVMPADAFTSTSFEFSSIDGRKIPVEVYSRGSVSSFPPAITKVLNELESDYGAFPHPKVVVYGAGSGGMEYSGATMTSLWALAHELFHSYNARGVMPSQGNAGWIDEAMSSWRDNKYSKHTGPGGITRMAGHSKWTRMTDDDAYTKGADFLSWIASRVESRGMDLKVFLRGYFAKHMHTTVTTETLHQDMEAFSGLDLDADFDKYIYGKVTSQTPNPAPAPAGSTWGSGTSAVKRSCNAPSAAARVRSVNPYHPRLTRAQLDALL